MGQKTAIATHPAPQVMINQNVIAMTAKESTVNAPITIRAASVKIRVLIMK